jgi:hypothetical protein
MTLQLLFPPYDRKALKGKPIKKSRWLPSWLQFLLNREKLDSCLLSAFVAEGHYQKPLTNRRELYERYPHWALRLHMLLEEVEDPTPLVSNSENPYLLIRVWYPRFQALYGAEIMSRERCMFPTLAGFSLDN